MSDELTLDELEAVIASGQAEYFAVARAIRKLSARDFVKIARRIGMQPDKLAEFIEPALRMAP